MAREQSLIVLPFEDSFVELSTALDSATVLVGSTEYPRGRNVLSEGRLRDFLANEVKVDVELDNEWMIRVLDRCGLKRSDVRLVVRTFSKFLNLSYIAYLQPLDDIEFGKIEIEVSRPTDIYRDPLRAIHTNFSIDVYLTLAIDKKSSATSLKPWKKHTILAWVPFSFLSKDDGVGLNVEKLDDEVRSRRRLPEKCATYIESGGSPIECTRLNECSTLYVDEKLIEKIRYVGNTQAGRAFQRSVGVDLISDVIMRSHSELTRAENLELTINDLRDTVAGKVIRSFLMKSQPRTGARLTESDILSEVRTDPERSIARAQSFFSMRVEMLKTFDGELGSYEI
jgi:hypothetical protein